jgi:hypothetical protein
MAPSCNQNLRIGPGYKGHFNNNKFVAVQL